MAYNLFVAYDLNKEPNSAGYTALFEGIKALGAAAKIQKSLWFVSSQYDIETAEKNTSGSSSIKTTI